MDAKTIFTKTAKGVTQVNQKTQSLSREMTRALKAIDGKSNVDALVDKADLAMPALTDTTVALTGPSSSLGDGNDPAVFQKNEVLTYTGTEQITGYSREELLRLPEFWQLAAPASRDLIRERSQARLRGEPVPARYEFQILHKSGETRWMDFTASNISYEGAPAALLMVFASTVPMISRLSGCRAMTWL